MIYRQWYFIPDDLPDFFYIFFQVIKAFFRNLDTCIGMACGDDLITHLMLYHILRHRSSLNIQNVAGILLHIVYESERGTDCSGNVHQKADAEIHFQKGKSHVHSALQGKPHRMARFILPVHIGITVNTYLISVFSAEELP